MPDATHGGRVKTAAPDEIVPLEALAEMHSTFVYAKPDRNYGYPWFHYFVTAAFQAPYVGYLYVSGRLDDPSAYYPYGMSEPASAVRRLAVVGRLSSVLMAAGVVVCAYLLGVGVLGAAGGVLAGGLTLLSFPLLYYSHTVNLDAPLLFWCSLGALAFADIARHGLTMKRAVGIGVVAAVATGTKDQGVLFFAPLGLALLAPGVNGRPAGRYPWKPLLAGFGASAAAYAAATGMLVDPQRHITHVRLMLLEPEFVGSPMAYIESLDATTAEGLLSLLAKSVRALSDVTSPMELILACGGAGILFRREPAMLFLLAPLVAVFLVLTAPIGFVVRRYWIPGLIPITLMAAAALVALYRRNRAAALALGVMAFGWKALVGADLMYRTLEDTRYAAAAWIREHKDSGDRIEHFSSPEAKPNLPADVSSGWVGGLTFQEGDLTRGPQILEYLREEGPRFVLIMPDWTSGPEGETSRDCPPEVFRALQDGSIGYKLGAHFPRPRLLPHWVPTPRLDSQAVAPPIRVFERRRS